MTERISVHLDPLVRASKAQKKGRKEKRGEQQREKQETRNKKKKREKKPFKLPAKRIAKNGLLPHPKDLRGDSALDIVLVVSLYMGF